MSHTFLTFCRRRGRMAGFGCGQDGGDRVDPSPRDHQIDTYRKWWVSETIEGLPGDTWSRQERPIFIAVWSRLHRTVAIFCDSAIGEHRVDRDCDLHRTVGVASHRHGLISIGRTMKEEFDRTIMTAQTYLIRSDGNGYVRPTIVAHDRDSIMAWSPRDRGWFSVKFVATTRPIDGPRSPLDHGHQSVPTTASNGPQNRAGIPL